MKRYLSIFVISLLAVSAMAADLPGQGFGLQIGYAQPTLRLNSSNILYPKDSLMDVTQLHGLKVGVVYDGSFIKGFGTSLGINYTFATKQSKWSSLTTFTRFPESRSQMMYHQIEVFADWQYKFEIAKETYLILFSGPTIQYGIAFTQKNEQRLDESGSISLSENVNRYGSDSPNTDLRQFNVTWGVGAGFQYQRFFLRGGYDFGLINPYKKAQFVNPLTGDAMDRNTRGRFDQWEIKIGAYLWYK